jgi:tetratricopeptide (TPR) repeat protein
VVDDSSELHKQLQALEADLEMYPDERLDLLLEIAGVHRELGAHDRAVEIWRDLIAEGGEDGDYARVEYLDHLFAVGSSDEARAELSALKAGRRTATGAWQIAAELLQEQGELAEALTWLTMATERLTEDELADLGGDAGWASRPGMLVRKRRSIRAEVGLPPDFTDLLVPDEDEILAQLRKPFPSLDEAVDAVRANGPARTEVRMLFWPRAEFQAARKRWHDVIDADVDESEYYPELEAKLATLAAEGAHRISIVPCDVDTFAAHLDQNGESQPDSASRQDYLDVRYRQGQYLRWPPQRNQPCWCGAAVKYKKCCGRIA